VVFSGKHSPFLKSKPCHPLGWHGFYFSDHAISAAPSPIPRQLSLSPVLLLAWAIKHPLNVPV
jgi:hypothetical protein